MANQKNVKKWVKALRSGRYKQCQSTLSDGKGYCCLGVVCVLAGMKRTPKSDGRYYFGVELSTLPLTAQRWLGIKVYDPLIGGERATRLNDVFGLSFAKIANLIEKKGVSE